MPQHQAPLAVVSPLSCRKHLSCRKQPQLSLSSPPTTACLNSHCRRQKGHFCSVWLCSHLQAGAYMPTGRVSPQLQRRQSRRMQCTSGPSGTAATCQVRLEGSRHQRASSSRAAKCAACARRVLPPHRRPRTLSCAAHRSCRCLNPCVCTRGVGAQPRHPPVDALQVERVGADAPDNGGVVSGELACAWAGEHIGGCG